MDSPSINSPVESVLKYIEIMKKSLKYRTQKKFFHKSKIPTKNYLNKSANDGKQNRNNTSSIYSKKKSEAAISNSKLSKIQNEKDEKCDSYNLFPSFSEEREINKRYSNSKLNVSEFNKSLIIYREILTDEEKKECVYNLKEIMKIIEKVSNFIQKENALLEEKLRLISREWYNLIKYLKLLPLDTNRLQLFSGKILGNIFLEFKEYKNALCYYKETKAFASRYKFQRDKMEIYDLMTICLRNLNLHEKAILYQRKKLEMALTLKDQKEEFRAYDNMGLESYYLGDIENANFYHSKMMKGEGEIIPSYQFKRRLTLNSGYAKTKGVLRSYIEAKTSPNNIKISKSENKINSKNVLRSETKQLNEKANQFDNFELEEENMKLDDFDLKSLKESQSQFIYKIFDAYNIFQKNNEVVMPHNTQYMRMMYTRICSQKINLNDIPTIKVNIKSNKPFHSTFTKISDFKEKKSILAQKRYMDDPKLEIRFFKLSIKNKPIYQRYQKIQTAASNKKEFKTMEESLKFRISKKFEERMNTSVASKPKLNELCSVGNSYTHLSKERFNRTNITSKKNYKTTLLAQFQFFKAQILMIFPFLINNFI